MKSKFRQLKYFNWNLFVALCALSLIPAVYQTIKTFLISYNNSQDVFNVIGQMEWFDLINETLQAFLIVPLYSVLNKIIDRDRKTFADSVFKTGIVTFIFYTLFSVGVLINGLSLINAMSPGEINLAETATYLRLETIAFMIGIIISFVNVVFVVVGRVKNVYIFLGVRTILSIIADFILIPFLGVYGVAVSNIIVNGVLSIASIALLRKQKLFKPSRFSKNDFPMLREWVRVGVFSGIQQLVDNLIYAVMICKMVNMVAEQDNYWIANNFIWGWLLIPIYALTEIIRRDCGAGYKKLRQFNYYFVGICTVLLWVASIPGWLPFYQHAEGLTNANEIFSITLKLVPFYIAYIGSAIIDNIFVGLGKTIYTFITSLLVNFVYYGTFYFLYLEGAIKFTIDIIILMFGFGMVVHWFISVIEECFFMRRNENKLQ